MSRRLSHLLSLEHWCNSHLRPRFGDPDRWNIRAEKPKNCWKDSVSHQKLSRYTVKFSATRPWAPLNQILRQRPPAFDAPHGVRIYRTDPQLTDVTSDHGGFVGGRSVDRVTHVFEEPGQYTLPATRRNLTYPHPKSRRANNASRCPIDYGRGNDRRPRYRPKSGSSIMSPTRILSTSRRLLPSTRSTSGRDRGAFPMLGHPFSHCLYCGRRLSCALVYRRISTAS
jgi:hypothetical protein